MMSSPADCGCRKKKFARTKTGCFGCRKAKRKCDEERPTCGRCARGLRKCSYPDPHPLASSSALTSDGSARSNRTLDLHEIKEISHGPQDHASTSTDSFTELMRAEANSLPFELAPLDLLAYTFPNATERELMKHFLCFGTVNLCAIPQPDKPIQFLEAVHCFQHARGSSAASDSLLLSLISIAAVHRSSLFFQLDKQYLTRSPVGRWGSPSLPLELPLVESSKRLRGIGNHLSRSSLEMCRTAIALQFPEETPTKDLADIVIPSVVCTIISQVMLGGNLWKEAFDIGLKMIQDRGGPVGILDEARKMSLENLARTRRRLEDLVIIDVCRCLASGAAPALLVEPFQPWWFDFPGDELGPQGLDTFQCTFGMDRGMLELNNRVNLLVYERHVLDTLSDKSFLEHHQKKVQDLLLELSVWELGLGDINDLTRIQFGNIIMIYTLRIVILVDLLKRPHSHPEVQDAASAALGYLEAIRAKWIVSLLLPTIIAGSMMLVEAGRDRARGIMTAQRSTFSFSYDVEKALNILENLFVLRDSGKADPSWREVMGGTLLF